VDGLRRRVERFPTVRRQSQSSLAGCQEGALVGAERLEVEAGGEGEEGLEGGEAADAVEPGDAVVARGQQARAVGREGDRAERLAGGGERVSSGAPLSAAKRRAVPSLPAVASQAPSGLKARSQIRS
jgi:hypothetical protein